MNGAHDPNAIPPDAPPFRPVGMPALDAAIYDATWRGICAAAAVLQDMAAGDPGETARIDRATAAATEAIRPSVEALVSTPSVQDGLCRGLSLEAVTSAIYALGRAPHIFAAPAQGFQA